VPRARYHVDRRELEHSLQEASERNDPIVADSVQPILDAGLAAIVDAAMVDMDARLLPEVRLMPTPGHTLDHVSVVIESGALAR
jgi:glyoxylase-like metal-dependent hydrolase (beta-lactamase superfamily II)